MELWLKDESDDPKSQAYKFDYHTGCMIQPSIERLVEHLNQMPSRLDTEARNLQTHAEDAIEAEKERNWESSYHEYVRFLEILHSIGFDLTFDRTFNRYGDYLWVTAWASIPCALYKQIKLGDYEGATIHLGALRATRDDEISERLPMLAYASIDQHIRIVDWETSYMLQRRGQVGLSHVLAERAVRDFPRDWLLNADTPAEATLSHLLGNQHRRFQQYEKAKEWRLELRKWLPSNLSLDAEVEISLDDVYLLCDMDDLAAASHKLLKVKQRISDVSLNLHLRWVLSVDNAWWQCRRYLALQDSPPEELSKHHLEQFQTIITSIMRQALTVSNEEFVPPPNLTESSPYTRLMQEVSNPVSCTDDFTDTVRMIENFFIVMDRALSPSSSQDVGDEEFRDFYCEKSSGQTKRDAFLIENFVNMVPEDSGLNSGTLWLSGTVGLRAEKSRIWDFTYINYQVYLTSLVSCDMPLPGSDWSVIYQVLFAWAALPYALCYHTQFKDYEHSIWFLQTIQTAIVNFPHDLLTRGAYAAVAMQVRMAAWEWSWALREEGMLDKAEVLSKVATQKFPRPFLDDTRSPGLPGVC